MNTIAVLLLCCLLFAAPVAMADEGGGSVPREDEECWSDCPVELHSGDAGWTLDPNGG